MSNVVAGGNESFESLLRRFTRKVQQDGVLSEIRHREYFEKPSIKRKKKLLAAKKRAMKRMRKVIEFCKNNCDDFKIRDQDRQGDPASYEFTWHPRHSILEVEI